MNQIILDTNVVYSALRSRKGASFRLLSLLHSGKYEINLSVPLVLEYEDVLKRKQLTLSISNEQIDKLLDYLYRVCNCHDVYFLWRPILRDPGDDLILELAVRAGCKYILTCNKADFAGVNKFGIQAVTAKEFLKVIEKLS
ncbi:putative toxin-antitoxin system toxin component, PIN family [Balneolaceae bacterium ANBcel3]|nr:putative toxin-antitoxin system toxin component, PIN family [Balneolaceae bacterium ANBcel3]